MNKQNKSYRKTASRLKKSNNVPAKSSSTAPKKTLVVQPDKDNNSLPVVIPIEKIAKIDTADLPIVHRADEPKEHYVYVREYDQEKQVYRVNVCTHLEKRDSTSGKKVNDWKNIQQVKYGNTYPVPIYSANFPMWTGIKRDVHEIPKGKLHDWDCVQFKKKHNRKQNDGFYSPSAPKS